VSFTVQFTPVAGEMPGEVRAAAHHTLLGIALAIGKIPRTSPFWESIADSLVTVNVLGWNIGYRILPDNGWIVVEQVSQQDRLPE
jgi:hypothetical protein